MSGDRSAQRVVVAYVHNFDDDNDNLYFQWYDPETESFGPIDENGDRTERKISLGSSDQEVRITSAPSLVYEAEGGERTLSVYFNGKLGPRATAKPMLFRLVLGPEFSRSGCYPVLDHTPDYPVKGNYLATNTAGTPTVMLGLNAGPPVVFAGSDSDPARVVAFSPRQASGPDSEDWNTSLVSSSGQGANRYLGGPVAGCASTYKAYLATGHGGRIWVASCAMSKLVSSVTDPGITWPTYDVPGWSYVPIGHSITPVYVPASKSPQLYLFFQSFYSMAPIYSVALQPYDGGAGDPGGIIVDSNNVPQVTKYGPDTSHGFVALLSNAWETNQKYGSPVAAVVQPGNQSDPSSKIYIAYMNANWNYDNYLGIQFARLEADEVNGSLINGVSGWHDMGTVSRNSCKPGICLVNEKFWPTTES